MEKTILTGIAYLMTGNDGEGLVGNCDLVLEGSCIGDVGVNLRKDYPDHREVDCRGCFVGPGLVNTHHHFYQAMFRGIPEVQGMELFDWLKTLYRYWEHLDEEIVHYGTQVALVELMKTGCTMASDHHYVFPRGASRELIDVQI